MKFLFVPHIFIDNQTNETKKGGWKTDYGNENRSNAKVNRNCLGFIRMDGSVCLMCNSSRRYGCIKTAEVACSSGSQHNRSRFQNGGLKTPTFASLHDCLYCVRRRSRRLSRDVFCMKHNMAKINPSGRSDRMFLIERFRITRRERLVYLIDFDPPGNSTPYPLFHYLDQSFTVSDHRNFKGFTTNTSWLINNVESGSVTLYRLFSTQYAEFCICVRNVKRIKRPLISDRSRNIIDHENHNCTCYCVLFTMLDKRWNKLSKLIILFVCYVRPLF